MFAFLQIRRRIACVLVVLIAVSAAAPTAQADDPKFKKPRDVYLALGDSLAFGYQHAKALAHWPPDASWFNTGYVDVFAADIGTTFPDVETINLGCYGETTDTFISATNDTTGCTTYPFDIHVNHPGTTQLQMALSVLAAHRGRAVPITLDIGANDVLATVRGCTNQATGAIDLECVAAAAPATFAQVQQNLAIILAQLRRAAPYSEIIVIGLYNPLYPAVFQQVLLQTGSPEVAAAAAAQTDAMVAQLNALMASTAQAYRAFFGDPLATFNPAGDPMVEIGTICTLTPVCTSGDVHPTDAGYEALADVVFAASGY